MYVVIIYFSLFLYRTVLGRKREHLLSREAKEGKKYKATSNKVR